LFGSGFPGRKKVASCSGLNKALKVQSLHVVFFFFFFFFSFGSPYWGDVAIGRSGEDEGRMNETKSKKK
jgi:hypothetical protein